MPFCTSKIRIMLLPQAQNRQDGYVQRQEANRSSATLVVATAEGHSFEKLRLKDDLKRVISGRGLDFDAKAWQPVDSKPVERRHLPRIR